MKDELIFTVSLPTDEGFVGRACKNPECGQYYKIFVESIKDVMFCPYCGSEFSNQELNTSDQREYALDVASENLIINAQEQFDNMLKNIFDTNSAKKSGIIYKSEPVYRRRIRPGYKERNMDSELICPVCDTKFQVYGIFGYCPGCKEENLLIYDANLNIIVKEINKSDDPNRQLRHAYGDLVSTFENFCSRKSKKITNEQVNFQDLFETRKFFKKHLNIDIFVGLSTKELFALRRVFGKRHLYTHSDGTINNKYIKKVPEDRDLLGKKAPLSLEELKLAAKAMRITLIDLIKAVEKKG